MVGGNVAAHAPWSGRARCAGNAPLGRWGLSRCFLKLLFGGTKGDVVHWGAGFRQEAENPLCFTETNTGEKPACRLGSTSVHGFTVVFQQAFAEMNPPPH